MNHHAEMKVKNQFVPALLSEHADTQQTDSTT